MGSVGFHGTHYIPDGNPAPPSPSSVPGISCRQVQPLYPFMDHQQQQQMLPDAVISLSHCIYSPLPTSVARRNERERNRVRFINHNFVRLREHLPCSDKKKKLSKVETLRTAIRYIKHLRHILHEQEKEQEEAMCKGSDAEIGSSGEKDRAGSDLKPAELEAGKNINTIAICRDFNDASIISDENTCGGSSSGSNCSSSSSMEDDIVEQPCH